jgi:hypothetical protein
MRSTNENPLEQALRLAASNAAHGPDFFHALLDANVYVLGELAGPPRGDHPAQEVQPISIQHWMRADGSYVIPFFSSRAVLQRVVDAERDYLAVPARALLEITRGATLVLNPNTAHAREFPPEDVASLLEDALPHQPDPRRIAEGATVLLSEPEQTPVALIDALTLFFATRREVAAGYVLMLQEQRDDGDDAEAHLVVGVAGEGNIAQVLREAGTVAADSAPPGQPVDLFLITPDDDELSRHFSEHVTPFYERSWGHKLTTPLQPGHA